jgi:hypothetical protein
MKKVGFLLFCKLLSGYASAVIICMMTLDIMMNTLFDCTEILLLIYFFCRQNWITISILYTVMLMFDLNYINRCLSSFMPVCAKNLIPLYHGVLQVLRHLGRLSETRIGHHRVIILLKPQ